MHTNKQNAKEMSIAVKTKSSASIRIDTELLNALKSNAKRDNRSLSNYMETILFDLMARQSVDRTEGLCQSLCEVRMIKDGQLKAKSAEELCDDLLSLQGSH